MNKTMDNFLRDRADAFFKNSQELFKKKQYDLAAFNLEQAAQLYLKHYLFSKTRDFPRTHSLDLLLQDIAKVHKHPHKVQQFRRANIVAVTDLAEAYLTSRYLPTVFPKEKVAMMRTAVAKLKKLL